MTRMTSHFPSRHCEIRLFTSQKSAWQMPQSTTSELGSVCATSLLPYKHPPLLGAQRRGLAPSRNRHDDADPVVKTACDGLRDTRHPQSQVPGPVRAGSSRTTHVAPNAHRFLDFVCVPSVSPSVQFTVRLSSHHCVVHEVGVPIAVLRVRVFRLDIPPLHWSPACFPPGNMSFSFFF